MKDYWKNKLTPWDSELLLMVESITEKPCEAKNGGDGYFFEADYEKHNDPQYILALWDAIEGRAGKRLIEINDNPDRHCIIAHIAFSEESFPALLRLKEKTPANIYKGDLYIDDDGYLVMAVKVCEKNAARLMAFVGNGEMEFSKGDPCVFRFLNASESVFADAAEGSYIIYQRPGHYRIEGGESFEKAYHLFQ